MSTSLTQFQIAEKSILDLQGRQTYLGNGFVAGLSGASLPTTAETPVMSISNPSGNSKSMFIFLKRFGVVKAVTDGADFIYYTSPTITGAGTLITPHNLRSNLNAISSTMVIHQLPTVSANGTFLTENGAFGGSAPTDDSVLTIIDPGVTLLLTASLVTAPQTVMHQMYWYEI